MIVVLLHSLSYITVLCVTVILLIIRRTLVISPFY